ncbi:Phospho-2-dehydro-3-deoxyheptonate aldolase 2, chloroplastic [Trifolium repens]|nr:Phospho-2-dehydro-3-deoxyheptonate aldolase 2, chloroplastic [Trifolium repens]
MDQIYRSDWRQKTCLMRKISVMISLCYYFELIHPIQGTLKCLFFSCDKYWDIEKVTEPKANVYRELAYRVNETLGFMTCAGLTFDHPIMTATDF